jgi:peptide-methionine (S)-S-oxide reductase
MLDFLSKKSELPTPERALPGRATAMPVSKPHAVLGTALAGDYPAGTEIAMFGMGCFWGCERLFWQQPGVHVTAVGYSGGYTPNPTYEEVCSGLTAHNEVVLVAFWPQKITYIELLTLFWQNHNPTQGMRQANDRGTQYRSGIYYSSAEQKSAAESSRDHYQLRLDEQKAGAITTEIVEAGEFYFAESYHQQYLAKNPGGYCNLQTLAKSGLPGLEL